MELVVLHIDDCPSWAEAGRRVTAALRVLGRADVPVDVRLIATPADAAATGFAGSPTILADGVDLFPGEPTTHLVCRVYRTPTGFAGSPTVDMIAETLRERLAASTGVGT
ncbi:alkylmercury lyase [Leifsonia aquatica]|uniref:alkylmercury lyase n=1 Tax=Leifsonia aquatica TaxID=144185 RepID=UPI00046930C3|nr:alkylmercury lyase [Leifsonia aquatica]